jgi:hypothetical protein
MVCVSELPQNYRLVCSYVHHACEKQHSQQLKAQLSTV